MFVMNFNLLYLLIQRGKYRTMVNYIMNINFIFNFDKNKHPTYRGPYLFQQIRAQNKLGTK